MATTEISLASALVVRPSATTQKPQKKRTSWRNLLVGAGMNIFQVTTLGQPLENMKTYVSANRNAILGEVGRTLLARGPFRGFYQGLIPWAWLEASTKGAILILTSAEVSYYSTNIFGLLKTSGA